MFIDQSRANLDEKISFGKIIDHKGLKIRKIAVRGLNGNRDFHLAFWSMICLPLKFKFNAIVIFR